MKKVQDGWELDHILHERRLRGDLHYVSCKGSNPETQNTLKISLSASLICPETSDFEAFVGRTPGLPIWHWPCDASEKAKGNCMVCHGLLMQQRSAVLPESAGHIRDLVLRNITWMATHKGVEEVN